jgi:hypothetical protein
MSQGQSLRHGVRQRPTAGWRREATNLSSDAAPNPGETRLRESAVAAHLIGESEPSRLAIQISLSLPSEHSELFVHCFGR